MNEYTSTHEKAARMLTICSFGLMLACLSVLSPGLYVLLFALLSCLGVVCGTVAMLATMDSFSAAIWGASIIRGAFEVLGIILRALLATSGNSAGY